MPSMFIAALFMTAKIWKQLNERIKKICDTYTHAHTHTMAIEKDEILPFLTTWMDLVLC